MSNERITSRSHPDLDWNPKPRVFWVTPETIQSAAYRSLSKVAADVLMFALSVRRYPRPTKKIHRDYHHPTNEYEILLPYLAIQAFLSAGGGKAPAESTITRAIHQLMAVGFVDVVHIGGGGPHDTSKYCLTHNWRVWKPGDPPVFSKEGLSRARGFCNRKIEP